MKIHGFHHITMNCRDARENVSFYRDFLGFRMVKQTVNFDDPFTYHLYYGDDNGSPGTLLTFFPFADIPEGKHGNNEIRTLTFAISSKSLVFWKERLEKERISFVEDTRFSQHALLFNDPDGLEIRLVAVSSQLPKAAALGIHALCGLYSVELHVPDASTLFPLLAALGYKETAVEGNVTRFVASRDHSFLDVVVSQEPQCRFGYGTVHHLAFHASDDSHAEVREELRAMGFGATPVIDRQYFRSIYFRTFEGLLFEVATTGPGMFVDEENLGATLQIPLQHTHIEKKIKERLSTL